MSYSLYMHTSPVGKRYIGITSQSVIRRWRDGTGYRHNSHFTNAIEKYGWENFTHEILLSGLTREQAEMHERFFIALLRTSDRRFGYNKDSGGNLGKTLSEESRAKLSKAHLGLHDGEKNPMFGKKHSAKTRALLSEQKTGAKNPWYGKHLPTETCKKISQAQKGKKRPEEGSRKMRDWNMAHTARKIINVETGELFGSIGEAAKKYGVSKSSIKDCLHGRSKTCRNCHWIFAEGV